MWDNRMGPGSESPLFCRRAGASLVAQTVKSACKSGDPVQPQGQGGSPGEGNGNPLQCSCLKNSMDKRAWRASPWGSQSRTRLSNWMDIERRRKES